MWNNSIVKKTLKYSVHLVSLKIKISGLIKSQLIFSLYSCLQLESKLKEVRDKKKNKKDRGAINNNHNNGEGSKCDPLPKNMDIKYKASGISGVGELDLSMRFGSQGNFTLWGSPKVKSKHFLA